jgi:hypothetical protein
VDRGFAAAPGRAFDGGCGTVNKMTHIQFVN